jgi:hypothetical protein
MSIDSADYAKAVEYGRVLERLSVQEGNIVEMRNDLGKMKSQLEELIAIANRGKGAWWVALTFVSGISSMLAWGVSSFWRS